MKKQQAIEILGGTITTAAKKIGISYQAVNKWPDPLPPRISDRVHAAAARDAQFLSMARTKSPRIDPAQKLTKLSPVERMALALAPKGSNFNTPIGKSAVPGTSAMARAKASI